MLDVVDLEKGGPDVDVVVEGRMYHTDVHSCGQFVVGLHNF